MIKPTKYHPHELPNSVFLLLPPTKMIQPAGKPHIII